jgi:hypothetical protein
MLIYTSDFIIDETPTACYKADYWSEKLLKYSVKIMGDCVEKQGAVTSQITKSMH